jgi:hypothetical protein
VAAAIDPTVYQADWWRSRQWTKTWFLEMQKLVWWELVDRWCYGRILRVGSTTVSGIRYGRGDVTDLTPFRFGH